MFEESSSIGHILLIQHNPHITKGNFYNFQSALVALLPEDSKEICSLGERQRELQFAIKSK